jgi:hypothetical protein
MRMPFLRAVAQTFTASYRWIILAGVWVDNTFPCAEIYRHIHTGTHTQVHTHKHKHKHIHTSTNTHLNTPMTAGRRASARARHDGNERNAPTVQIQELQRHCIYNPWKFHKNQSEDEKVVNVSIWERLKWPVQYVSRNCDQATVCGIENTTAQRSSIS